MSSTCEKTNTTNLGCHPYVTIGCIISCAICTIIMIWGTLAMRADMERMEKMMKNNTSPMMSMTSTMNMSDPMSMSMHDMGKMLDGQTGDTLDRAFLEGMIPHHQGAVNMAKYLSNAKHPELRKMGQDIITAQEKEIAQMKQWMIDWGYTGSSSPKDEMMREHCKSMPEMMGCEEYK